MTPSVLESTGKATGAIRPVSADQVKPCDFRAAGILDASRLAPLSAANEVFARNLAETFKIRFEVPCEIVVNSLEVAACEAFVEGASKDSPYLHSLVLGSHDEMGVLQMDAVVLFALLDSLMGGRGISVDVPREVTEIEGQMAKELVKIIAHELQGAWRAFNIEVRVGTQQSPQHLLQTLPPSATALVPSLNINIAEVRGQFQLMLPIPSIAPFLKPAAGSPTQLVVPASTMSPRLASDLLESRFGLDLVLTKGKVRAKEILNMCVGQILPLGVPAGSPVVASVGGRAAFSAMPVRSGEYRAAQLVERISQDKARKNLRIRHRNEHL